MLTEALYLYWQLLSVHLDVLQNGSSVIPSRTRSFSLLREEDVIVGQMSVLDLMVNGVSQGGKLTRTPLWKAWSAKEFLLPPLQAFALLPSSSSWLPYPSLSLANEGRSCGTAPL